MHSKRQRISTRKKISLLKVEIKRKNIRINDPIYLLLISLIAFIKGMEIHLTLLCTFCCTMAFSTLSISLFEDLFLSTVFIDLFIGDTLALRFLGSIFITVLMIEIMLSSF
jgi:hypothetical protein